MNQDKYIICIYHTLVYTLLMLIFCFAFLSQNPFSVENAFLHSNLTSTIYSNHISCWCEQHLM